LKGDAKGRAVQEDIGGGEASMELPTETSQRRRETKRFKEVVMSRLWFLGDRGKKNIIRLLSKKGGEKRDGKMERKARSAGPFIKGFNRPRGKNGEEGERMD